MKNLAFKAVVFLAQQFYKLSNLCSWCCGLLDEVADILNPAEEEDIEEEVLGI
jgi:hypothetical protein